VSVDAVVERDRLVLTELAARDIPAVIVTSGGYSSLSHELIARMAFSLMELL
jgi:hypothetical protein